MSTRAITESLHTCTEDASVLYCAALLRNFYAILAPNTYALTYLFTYLCDMTQQWKAFVLVMSLSLLPFSSSLHLIPQGTYATDSTL